MQPILLENQEKIAELCRTHYVKRLAVSGSAVRVDFDPESSDVDSLVEFEPLPYPESVHNWWNLQRGLAAVLSRPVDLIRDGVELVEYTRNRMMRLAVERCFITIGEAMVRIRQNLPAEYAPLPEAPQRISFQEPSGPSLRRHPGRVSVDHHPGLLPRSSATGIVFT